MRLIYRQGNYGSINFPYKKSCQFATRKCLKECSEQFNNMTWFEKVFAEFKTKSSVELYADIKEELKDNDFNLLTWFDCGDCPSRLQTKVVDIINQLHNDRVSQLGFTRNEKFWLKVKDLHEDDRHLTSGPFKTRFMLTVERGTVIKKEGYYAVPDYKKQQVCIIHHHTFSKPEEDKIDNIIARGGAHVRYCGGGGSYIPMKTVTEPEFIVSCLSANSNTAVVREEYESNCQYCLEDGKGCFKESNYGL